MTRHVEDPVFQLGDPVRWTSTGRKTVRHTGRVVAIIKANQDPYQVCKTHNLMSNHPMNWTAVAKQRYLVRDDATFMGYIPVVSRMKRMENR